MLLCPPPSPPSPPCRRDVMAPFFNISPTSQEWARIKDTPYCAGGSSGFVAGSDAERLILQPVAACMRAGERCVAPPGHNRSTLGYDQSALTLMIRHHNFR